MSKRRPAASSSTLRRGEPDARIKLDGYIGETVLSRRPAIRLHESTPQTASLVFPSESFKRKRRAQSVNQFAMTLLFRVAAFLALSVIAAAAGEQPSFSSVSPPVGSEQRLSPAIKSAQRTPSGSTKVEPIDPKTAFVEGYKAYKRHDPIAVIGPMRLATLELPQLEDYALYYLACAERDDGDTLAATNDFRRLGLTFPQSVFSDAAGLEYARLELKLQHPSNALTAATTVADATKDPILEQNARLTMAFALLAIESWRAAYNQAQLIRQKFPRGPADAPARQLAYATLRAHLQANNASPLEYHRTEAALLLREGQDKAALNQIQAAMALRPPRTIQAELTWFSAEAFASQPARMQAELHEYLDLAPNGPEAARALNGLAHLSWHQNNTQAARLYFDRLQREFPLDALAPQALFEIGRTYEEDGDLTSARSAYNHLVARYSESEAAADARFRAPFMLYMLRRYGQAAAEFNAQRIHAATSSGRDMFAYWQARALENDGGQAEARRLLQTLALSTDSNYYPALAAMRVRENGAVLSASFGPDLVAAVVPTADGPIQFHLTRIAELRELGLRDLEPPELRAIEGHLGADKSLMRFALAEMQSSGAWFDAIQMAMRMVARGKLDPATAERIRYPRGFWDLVTSASARNQLDPNLVTALIRQESLFNPQALSVSDARGLMQLLPGTAARYAEAAGVAVSPADLYDPHINVQIGTVYLRELIGMFGGDIFKSVAAYNAGEHAVADWNARNPGEDDQWVENIGFRETRDYVKKVIGGMREYRLLYRSPPTTSASTPTRPSPG
jgi:soluble lytic murein transglycosylase